MNNILMLLSKHGALHYITNNDNETVFQLAKLNDYDDLVDISFTSSPFNETTEPPVCESCS